MKIIKCKLKILRDTDFQAEMKLYATLAEFCRIYIIKFQTT